MRMRFGRGTEGGSNEDRMDGDRAGAGRRCRDGAAEGSDDRLPGHGGAVSHRQEAKEIEKATGYKVNWKQFGGGGEVIKAMASGAVQIGEVGSAGIAAALSRGEPYELFWILDDIGDAEALVAKNGSGINSIADLKGKKIAMPFNSTTHFHTMVALEQAKVNPADVQILNMRPPEVRAAWQRGDIQATFIWDPVLAEVKKDGKVILTSGKISADTGKATFDGYIVNKDWAKANQDFMVKFTRSWRRPTTTTARTGEVEQGLRRGEGGGQVVRRQAGGRAGRHGAVQVPDARASRRRSGWRQGRHRPPRRWRRPRNSSCRRSRSRRRCRTTALR